MSSSASTTTTAPTDPSPPGDPRRRLHRAAQSHTRPTAAPTPTPRPPRPRRQLRHASPSASTADSTTSASAEPTPEPTSSCSSTTSTSASSTPPPANSSATSPSTPPATTSPPAHPKAPPAPQKQTARTPMRVRAVSDVLRHHTGALGRIRTCDTRFRKPMLYPLSYEGLDRAVAGPEGYFPRPAPRVDRCPRAGIPRTPGSRVEALGQFADTT